MKRFLFLVLLIISFSAYGQCNEFWPVGKPVFVPNTIELCNSFYVSVYNPKTRAVIMTSEILAPSGLKVKRSNNFHSDSRVSNPVIPKDYNKSGFDRGHMVPAGDAPTISAMSETFLMTNMTPQAPMLNRGNWKELEESIRHQVNSSRRPVYVITGAIYSDKSLSTNVPIPSGYFKVVYFSPIVIYYADNSNASGIKGLTLDELRTMSGYNF